MAMFRDSVALVNDCLPWQDSVDCETYLKGHPPSCFNQLLWKPGVLPPDGGLPRLPVPDAASSPQPDAGVSQQDV